MNRSTLCFLFSGLFLILSNGCKKEPDEPIDKPDPVLNTVPEFYKAAKESVYGNAMPILFKVADAGQNINAPMDLDFHPHRKNELWVLNRDDISSGGSTVTITDAGEAGQATEHRRDDNAYHFMSQPTALAFSNNGNWGTSADVFSANHNESHFAGPTLWSSNMDIYAKPSGENGSHLDMLHQSPYSMGIESEWENIFWVFDGFHGNIVMYDFMHDHGPGMHDHSDGVVRRFPQAAVQRLEGVPSHMRLDPNPNSTWLYVASAAEGKIYRLDIRSGVEGAALEPDYEPLSEYHEVLDPTWETFNEGAVQQPCGIEINGDRLFVSDHATGDIVVFSLETKKEIDRLRTGLVGITGLKTGPDNKLWFTSSKTNEVYRIDPQ